MLFLFVAKSPAVQLIKYSLRGVALSELDYKGSFARKVESICNNSINAHQRVKSIYKPLKCFTYNETVVEVEVRPPKNIRYNEDPIEQKNRFELRTNVNLPTNHWLDIVLTTVTGQNVLDERNKLHMFGVTSERIFSIVQQFDFHQHILMIGATFTQDKSSEPGVDTSLTLMYDTFFHNIHNRLFLQYPLVFYSMLNDKEVFVQLFNLQNELYMNLYLQKGEGKETQQQNLSSIQVQWFTDKYAQKNFTVVENKCPDEKNTSFHKCFNISVSQSRKWYFLFYKHARQPSDIQTFYSTPHNELISWFDASKQCHAVQKILPCFPNKRQQDLFLKNCQKNGFHNNF